MPAEIKTTYLIAIVVMLLLVGFIILIVVLYTKRQQQQLVNNQIAATQHQNQLLQLQIQQQQQLMQQRERIALDLHDELGAGISALKLQAEFIKQYTHTPQQLNDIEELKKTAQNMSLSMREMLWSLNTQEDTPEKLVQYIENYAQGFLQKSAMQLNCTHQLQQTVLPITISFAVKHHLLQCVKEALNNAYKYSQATELQINTTVQPQNIILTITDNGIGLPCNYVAGNGLKNFEKRMQQVQGTFAILPTPKGVRLQFVVNTTA